MPGPGDLPDRVHETPEKGRDVFDAFRDGERIDRALRKGVREALIEHKKLGHSIIVGVEGKPVRLSPDQIPIDD